MLQITLFGEVASEKIVNVASVPFRSPFRYPGGKTWFVPRVRKWLGSKERPPAHFVEPFAGGAIVGLTVAFEKLADHVTLVELDSDVAAVWKTMLNGQGRWLAKRILSFDLTSDSVQATLETPPETTREQAFATIVKNRVNRGGILAPGAGQDKKGENGKGLRSRWYPETLHQRIMDITAIKDRISFLEKDGLDCMEEYAGDENAVFFIDPPYTVAAKRLYAHWDIDHDRLFRIASSLSGDFLMTYDNAEEIKDLARKHDFDARLVPMKNTHHAKKMELLISRDFAWLESKGPAVSLTDAESRLHMPAHC